MRGWVFAAWAVLTASPLAAETVCLDVRFVGPSPGKPPHGELKLTTQKFGPGTRSVSIVSSLPPLGRTNVEVPHGGLWNLEIDSSEVWAEPRWTWVEKPEAEEPCVALKLYRLARLGGRAEGAPLPGNRFQVRFSGSPKVPAVDRLPRGQVICPIAADRTFTCSVPAGLADLRLHAPGFVASYFWDLSLSPAEPRDLGRISWRRGASVVGWIQPAPGEELKGKTTLELLPEVSGQRTDLERAQGWARRVEANSRGFFQFPEVVPGVYRLAALHAGKTSPRIFPVEVKPNLETEIRHPLVLSSPVALTVSVDPPLAPEGTAWNLEIEPSQDVETPEAPDVYTGILEEVGLWRFPNLPPGSYRLSVRGSEGARWWIQSLEALPGMAPVAIEIPLVPVQGLLLLGRRPLAARMMFGGLFGSDRKVPFASDERGRFEGLLPGEGIWKVDLISQSPFLRQRAHSVEVRRRGGKSFAEVEIRLPDTWLHGEVVDEKDRPLPEAKVRIRTLTEPGSDQTRADREGKFEVRGLEAGRLLVLAEAGERSSEWMQVDLEESRESGTKVRLIARLKKALEGAVTAEGLPVPGVRLKVWPDWTAVPIVQVADAVTGSAGEFTVTLPAGLSAVNVIAMAPGFPLVLRRMTLPDPPRIDVQLAAVGGTLILEAAPGETAPAGTLVHGGAFAGIGILEEWIRLQSDAGKSEGRWTLPRMEAGEYLLCRGPESGAALHRGAAPPPGACVAGGLAPLGELVLSSPNAPAPPGPG